MNPAQTLYDLLIIIIIIIKNLNRSPWLKAQRTGATHTLTWIARIHSHTYINTVTAMWCEAPAQLLFFSACWVFSWNDGMWLCFQTVVMARYARLQQLLKEDSSIHDQLQFYPDYLLNLRSILSEWVEQQDW